jgi:hypothetical protein
LCEPEFPYQVRFTNREFHTVFAWPLDWQASCASNRSDAQNRLRLTQLAQLHWSG